MAAPRVVVFGECLVDWFEGTAIPGGAPFNVARHLGGLGLEPLFVSRVGADAHGRLLLDELRRCGIDPDRVQLDALRPSGQVIVHARPGGHDFEILPDQAYDHIDWNPALARVLAGARAAGDVRPTWLYFGTLAQRSAGNRATLQRLRAAWPHQAFVDLNWRDGQVGPQIALAALDQADEIKLSAEELELLLGWSNLPTADARQPARAGARSAALHDLLGGRRVRRVIVTYGAAGYASWNAGGICELHGTAAALPRLVDTVGAGDAFAAIALAGQLLGWPRAQALARANEFAAAICAVRGAVPDDPDFYARWKRAWQLPPA
jgi:fructokinase